jgi:hypothetical protein
MTTLVGVSGWSVKVRGEREREIKEAYGKKRSTNVIIHL